MSFYETIRRYIEEYNWGILPVKYKGKNPIIENWTSNPIRDVEEFEEYVPTNGKLNVGVLCGKANNIVVIDIDICNETGYNGIVSIVEKEIEMRCKLPETVSSQTQGGGKQLWFKYPTGVDKLKSTTNKLRKVDIRADGSQVVAYPSVGEKGSYLWLNSPETTELAELPQEWIDWLTGEDTYENNMGGSKIRLTKKNRFELPDTIDKGNRNDVIFKYTCSLIAKGLPRTAVEKQVNKANKDHCSNPLGADELDIILNSAFKIRDKDTQDTVVIDNGEEHWLSISEKGKLSINEPQFAKYFVEHNQLYCVNGMIYNSKGVIPDDAVRNMIQQIIEKYVISMLASKVSALLQVVKTSVFIQPTMPAGDVIHFNNGSYKVTPSGQLVPTAQCFTFNQLDIAYDPKATAPLWEKYIRDLFEEEDINVIQEYLGYCLLPTTKCQKALFIMGSGGEGKSGLFVILSRLFKNSAIGGQLHKLEENRFLIANLENKLLFIDDDLRKDAMESTEVFKTIVTSRGTMEVEKKGVQHFTIQMYVKLISLCNHPVRSKYDKSDGFYDRLLLVRVKKKQGFQSWRGTAGEDRDLYERIMNTEMAGVAKWCIDGLCRLVQNKFNLSISTRSLNMVDALRLENDTIRAFFESKTKITFDEKGSITSKELRAYYEAWCRENDVPAVAVRSFHTYLSDNNENLGIKYVKNVKDGKSYSRGYTGIRLLDEDEPLGSTIPLTSPPVNLPPVKVVKKKVKVGIKYDDL